MLNCTAHLRVKLYQVGQEKTTAIKICFRLEGAPRIIRPPLKFKKSDRHDLSWVTPFSLILQKVIHFFSPVFAVSVYIKSNKDRIPDIISIDTYFQIVT